LNGVLQLELGNSIAGTLSIASAWHNDQDIASERVHGYLYRSPASPAYRHHQHNRSHADDDPKHGEERPQPVRAYGDPCFR
jgi:hypothetical protein